MRAVLPALLLCGCASAGNAMARHTYTTREEIRPADYGLTEAQWKLCQVRIGPAGNLPADEAEWCAKNIASLEADEKEKREHPERERRAQEEAAQQAELVEQWKRSPEIRAAALSAKICRYAQWRETVMEDARRERGYAEEVGSVNLARLEQDKTVLRDIDDAAARWRGAFNGAAPAKCSDPLVARIAPCVYADAGGGVRTLWVHPPDAEPRCTSPELKPYLSVLGQ